MNVKRLLARLRGERIRPDPDPDGEGPLAPGGVYVDDALFIARSMAAEKWGGVKYCGPGAAAAEARRRGPQDAPKNGKGQARRALRDRARQLTRELRDLERAAKR